MKPKISVALVSHDMVPVTFAYDLASLCAYTVAALPDDVAFGINMVKGTYVHTGRQEMIEALIAEDVTHIVWIDTDMRFPKDAIVRLLQHKEPVVGINYCNRGLPPRNVAIKEVGTDLKNGAPLQTSPESTGLEKVEAIGFGLLMMRTSALARMPVDEPWFGFEWMPRRRKWVGEDVYFCNLLRKSGVDIYVDHDLSKECAHTGAFEYRLDHVHAWNEEAQG